MPRSPAVTKRGEFDAEVDFDPFRAANIAKLLESWMPLSVALNNVNRAMGQPDRASGLHLGPIGDQAAHRVRATRLWSRAPPAGYAPPQ
jgi:hypothetical protein